MSKEEQAGHNLSHSKYINLPQCPEKYKRFFLTLKEITYSKHICYKTNYIALLTRNTTRLLVLTYLPSLAVWQKNHVMFDMELDVQMEGRFNIWKRFIRCPEACDDSVSNFFEDIILNVPQCLGLILERILVHLSDSPIIVVLEYDISK
jgi:hypothetical protein